MGEGQQTLPAHDGGGQDTPHSGSIAIALFKIQNGCNGGLEGALRAIDQMGTNIGFLLEKKLTGGIYTCFSSGYEVFASMAISVRQGGIALFWRGNNFYEVEEMQNWRPNINSLHLMMGDIRFYVVGCYIPPS